MLLETQRLILRQLSLDDAEFILALLNDPDFVRNIGDRGVRTTEDARAYIERTALASYARFGFGLYAVVLRGTGEVIGICGLIQRDELEYPDVGFAFLPAHRSKGYAVESASAVVAYARGTLGHTRLHAIVLPENAPSIRLLKKIGFRPEGRVRMSEDGSDLELHVLDPTSSSSNPQSPSRPARSNSEGACSLGFAELFHMAQGRDWTRAEKEAFEALSQSTKNARVEEWAAKAGGIRTEERRGTDGVIYKAFWKES